MLTTIIIVSVIFDAWLIFCIWKTRKQMLFWRSQNLRAAEQAVRNAEIANNNFKALEVQKKYTRHSDICFLVSWLIAVLLWIKLYRLSREKSAQ